MLRSGQRWLFSVLWATTLAVTSLAEAQDKPRFAGPSERGFVLPNGWIVTPAGEQVTLPDLPLNIALTPDGRYALTATSGFNNHELSLVDLQTRQVVATERVRQSWYGLAFDAASGRIWW